MQTEEQDYYTQTLDQTGLLEDRTFIIEANDDRPVEMEDGYGIMVYGIEGSWFDEIEEYFLQFGPITAKGIPQRGNRLYFWYENLEDCMRAMEADGDMLYGKLIIGVCALQQDNLDRNTMKYRMPRIHD
eukprot:TRINITY_DN8276_c0_g6_i1.p1 TRINITY_DN8276_c0_g6~~TRINITY_DN8276_c0_g6_i1.p1  ORF type:complete len:129 (-),score=32.09 TRINITY_DN8276_c0_g6_i1:140-526(-)